ncbi:MAG: hypothetical protein QOH35_1667, partial [Acidobacteriaceae bacterium]|nr:hypothetical protein [Acidobacteriaceae bacterium]
QEWFSLRRGPISRCTPGHRGRRLASRRLSSAGPWRSDPRRGLPGALVGARRSSKAAGLSFASPASMGFEITAFMTVTPDARRGAGRRPHMRLRISVSVIAPRKITDGSGKDVGRDSREHALLPVRPAKLLLSVHCRAAGNNLRRLAEAHARASIWSRSRNQYSVRSSPLPRRQRHGSVESRSWSA